MNRGQKAAFEKWPVFGLILTYVLKTKRLRACQRLNMPHGKTLSGGGGRFDATTWAARIEFMSYKCLKG
jgi:hypothetical protein